MTPALVEHMALATDDDPEDGGAPCMRRYDGSRRWWGNSWADADSALASSSRAVHRPHENTLDDDRAPAKLTKRSPCELASRRSGMRVMGNSKVGLRRPRNLEGL